MTHETSRRRLNSAAAPFAALAVLLTALVLAPTARGGAFPRDPFPIDNRATASLGPEDGGANAPAEADEGAAARHHRSKGDDDRVTVFSDNSVGEAESVEGDAVAVFGDLRMDGKTSGDAVAVFGSNTVNGEVHGDAVAVFGDLNLGDRARVDGDAVCVGGKVNRAPGAVVGGQIVNEGFGKHLHVHMIGPLKDLRSWWLHGLRGPHLGWIWALNLAVLVLYALVALIFPKAVRRVGDALAKRPGMSVLSAVLAVIFLPVLFLLLLITIIGIPIAILVIPVGAVGMMMFGKCSFYALAGRWVSRDRLHPSVAVLVGGLICLVIFVIPIVGLPLSLLLSFLGLGCCLTAIFGSIKTAAPQPPPAAPAASAAAAPAYVALPGVAEPPPISGSPSAGPAAASFPRAGFWIRTWALLIDLILIGVCLGPIVPKLVVLALAAYGAFMWKFKGATIGGIICGLKVVRLDDRPTDWPTAIVRALGCFLSLIPLGLGFIWVAFDARRQSWHDKIAGTVVVRPPRGVSLL